MSFDFGSVEVPVAEAQSGVAAWPGQLALLVADTPDLEAVPGRPLPGAAAAAAADPSGVVVADPEVIVGGGDARAQVFAELLGSAPLVTGTLVEARL